jgi:hypothetical protein
VRAEASQDVAAPDERDADPAADLHRHVAAVHDRDEQDPRAARTVDAKTLQLETAHDSAGHAHSHADPEPHPHGDATSAQRARRQEDEDMMVARFCVPGRLDAHG